MNERDILYQCGAHWVCREGSAYRVYRDGVTHAVRTDSIGVSLPGALERAKRCADERERVTAQQASFRRAH